MNNSLPTPSIALRNAREALKSKNLKEAFHWAKILTELKPEVEEGWLILGACAEPQESVKYLIKALEINPTSDRARQGMDWAVRRLRKHNQQQTLEHPHLPQKIDKPIPQSVPQKTTKRNKNKFLLIGVAIFAVLVIASVWFLFPTMKTVFAKQPMAHRPEGAIQKFTITPTATATATSTSTPTATSTSTATPTSTPTSTSTSTPTPTFTATFTPEPTLVTDYGVVIPEEVDEDTRWIDIDLSDQMLYAYNGDTLVNSFLVSTGTWQTPTVIGEYHIYVKYRYTDMRGPGYYLPDVPYTMYFYKGYGIHGTYWHDNFGTPMSHGCVNMRTSEAEWMFDFASVGTLVNVHP